MKMYDKFLSPIGGYRQFLVALLGLCFPAWSADYAMSDISALSTQWLQQQLTASAAVNQDTAVQQDIKVHPLDPRLPAKSCELPLEFSLVSPKVQRQNTIRVLCPDSPSWQLFLSAKVSQLSSAVTANRQIPTGTLISSEMLSMGTVETTQIRGNVVQDPAFILGARAKRSINQGQILSQHDLCLVCKGDVVTIEGISSGLTVTTQATALQDGTLGDSVRVQNNQSNRVIKAEIVAVKRVAIKL
jgi:flagella basal body P-ring formation protein FlgA